MLLLRDRPRDRERGVTLVEVMISMGLTGIVTMAALSLQGVFAGAVTNQISAGDMNENGWAAGEIVARQLRRAGQGFGMCPEGRWQQWKAGMTYSTNPSYAMQPVVATNGKYCLAGSPCTNPADPSQFATVASGDAPDMLDIYYGDGKMIDGSMPRLSLGGDFGLASDYAPGQSPRTFTVGSSPAAAGFASGGGDFFVLWSPADTTMRCALFRSTGVTGNTIAASASDTNNPSAGGESAFLAGAIYKVNNNATITRVGQLRHVRLFIKDPLGPNPKLMMDRFDRDANNDGVPDVDASGDPLPNPQVVATDIEDFQVAVACDRSAKISGNSSSSSIEDGAGDDPANPLSGPVAKRSDDYYPNVPSDRGGDACYDAFGTSATRPAIVAVRFTLVARTKFERLGMITARPPLEDRPAPASGANSQGGTLGGYSRRIQTTVVTMRNLF